MIRDLVFSKIFTILIGDQPISGNGWSYKHETETTELYSGWGETRRDVVISDSHILNYQSSGCSLTLNLFRMNSTKPPIGFTDRSCQTLAIPSYAIINVIDAEIPEGAGGSDMERILSCAEYPYARFAYNWQKLSTTITNEIIYPCAELIRQLELERKSQLSNIDNIWCPNPCPPSHSLASGGT